jgi:hypothetical protein
VWGRLFAHIATATGWTFPAIRWLTLWEVRDLTEYWTEHPPAHNALAGLAVLMARAQALGAAVESAPGNESSSPNKQSGVAGLASFLGVEVPSGAAQQR